MTKQPIKTGVAIPEQPKCKTCNDTKKRSEALRAGAYCLTRELYESLKRGDVVVFADKDGKETHTSIMLAGVAIEQSKDTHKSTCASLKHPYADCTCEQPKAGYNPPLSNTIIEPEMGEKNQETVG